MTAEQGISNDNRIVKLLELLANNQMNAQAEQVRQMCGYVEMLEQQIVFMTEEIKSVRQEMASMKEETISNYVRYNLRKATDTLQKQCESFKQQIKEVKEKVCKMAGKIVDRAKWKGQRALYKTMQITSIRRKLNVVKNKVDQAIEKVESLEKAMGECREQQEKSSHTENPLPDCTIVEPQTKYSAELFEQYQRKHGTEQSDRTAGQRGGQEVEKSR